MFQEVFKILKNNTEKNGVNKNQYYLINEERTIPVSDFFKILRLDGELIFDEEITIFEDGIYEDNKIRIRIEKNDSGINVFSADYEEQCGLAYCIMRFSNKEFREFDSIEDFIDKVFIKGYYDSRGISIATGRKKEDAIKEQEIELT